LPAAKRAGVDVVVYPEVNQDNHHLFQYLKAHYGVNLRAVLRARRGDWGSRRGVAGHSAGVAVASFNKQFNVYREFAHTKGVISVSLHRAGYKPVAIIGAYVPCDGSPQEDWTIEILSIIETEYKRLYAKAKFAGRVFIALDANMRLGSFGGRHTDDPRPDGCKRTKLLRSLCSRLRVAPLHGRTVETTATTTSRHIDPTQQGESEIDYVLGPIDLPADQFHLVRPDPFNDVPDGVTHRLISVALDLVPEDAKTTPPACGCGLGHAAGQPCAPPPRHAHGAVPTWFDPRNADAASRIKSALEGGVQHHLDDPATTSADAYHALHDVFTGLGEDVYRPTAADAAAADPVKHSGGNGAFRRYHHMNLPAAVVQQLAKARSLLRRASKVARRVLKGGFASPADKAAAQRMRDDAKRATNAARAAARAHLTTWKQDMFRLLESARARHPHQLHRTLDRLCPPDHTVYDGGDATKPQLDGKPPPSEYFSLFFSNQFDVQRPLPDGATSDDWLQYVPTGAGGEVLSKPISASEVFLVLFPPSKRLRPEACDASCKLCEEYLQRWDAWDGGPDGAPVYTPHAHTSTAPGPDNLPPEYFCFPRPSEEGDRFPFRMTVCRAFASLFSKIMRERAMPVSATDNRTIPLLKQSKNGAAATNPGEPNDHRPITIGDFIPKLFGLVLTSRLYHWCVLRGIVHPSQIGFMPLQGCEQHILTIRDAIKWQWSKKESVYALFVDFKKAYDMVHPGALWAILRRMGVPGALVDLLADWSGKRTSTITVNGVTSAPFRMSTGVAQGDVMSPLLFNLFIESLGRYVHHVAQNTDIGIVSAGVPILDLKYADDVCILCRTPRGVQQAIDAVQRWSDAWGMQLGIGNKKTEAMAFHCPTVQQRVKQGLPVPALPALSAVVGGAHEAIPWVDEYKYLGYLLRPDLNTEGMTAALAAKLATSWDRYFVANPFVRQAAPAFALQLFKTLVLGSGNYLLGLTEPSKEARNAIDRVSLKAARGICRTVHKACRETLWAESGLPMAAGIMARERARIALQMQLTPFQDSIASRLFRALAAEKPNGAVSRTTTCWVHRMTWLQKDWAAKGVVAAAPAAYFDITRVAAVYGRQVGMHEFQSTAKDRARRAAPPGQAPTPVTADTRPGCSPLQCAYDLNLGYDMQLAGLGTTKGITPLSARGPGCLGGVIALSNKWANGTALHALGRVRQGRSALHVWPLAPPGRRRADVADLVDAGLDDPDDVDGDDDDADSPEAKRRRQKAGLARWNHNANKDLPCTRCHLLAPGVTHEDPFHVLVECCHPNVVAARRALLVSLPAKLKSICLSALMAAIPAARASNYARVAAMKAEAAAEAQAIADLATATDWSSHDGRFVLFRLLMVLTWPERVCDASHPLSCAVGRVWDKVCAKPCALRSMANSWVEWSGRSLVALTKHWSISRADAAAQR
jgi:hypothetical protein